MKFNLEFDLKFEISDGKNLVKFGGGLFYLPGKHGKFRGEFRGKFSEKISETSFQNFATFFRNFVRQKGGAKELRTKPPKLQTNRFYIN